jgi:tetratricopeptide (TPR) repeat protein
MPFGEKNDPSRPSQPAINFNTIYLNGIKPAIQDAGMVALRADEEKTLGIIHKPMFEQLLLCDFAIADLTIPNPNVFYELGVRHASRHNTTLPIFADHAALPFDVALLRALPYKLQSNNSFGVDEASALREALGTRLKQLRELSRTSDAEDSPLFQLVTISQQGNLPPDAALRRIRETDSSLYELLNRYSGHEKTDVFREAVAYASRRKQDLAAARQLKKSEATVALNTIREDMRPFEGTEAGAIIDLYLSYRAMSLWDEMISLYDDMPEILKRTTLVREQLAFALNRRAPRDPKRMEYRERAIAILKEVIAQNGPSSETGGLLGRVYKDRWQEALSAGQKIEARGHLKQAIEAYVTGFRADSRDAYPGINAATLLDIEGTPTSLELKDQILPVVRFVVDQRIRRGNPDYWDYATLLEAEVLGNDENHAMDALAESLSRMRETWEPETTAKNLNYIYSARSERSMGTAWLKSIIDELVKASSGNKD